MENGFTRSSASELVKFQVERNVAALFKNFLIILEDIRDDEPFNYERLRKRVLDAGNGAIRDIEEQLDLFKIDYK